MAKRIVSSALSAVQRRHGLRRKGSTLYVDLPDVIGMIKLRRSTWGGRSFVDIALWLRALGESDEPNEMDAHIRSNMEFLFPGEEEHLASLLRDEDWPDPETVRTQLETYLDRAVAELCSLGTLEALACTREGERFLFRALRVTQADELLAQISSRNRPCQEADPR